ncbi:hypothetical protein AMAG_13490 [Allomyces macrogynus ATCC 38327]|uniref:Spt20-like SEP domain-containing protein n=1 Tax=Allomyces macrogynus (strain ATCC 38327) TaxID=578462 RepID=A0A0L0T2G7_ALLM3|nr:hypothetical protein AMAG_13490 [Allomyces macrogynus ATCC 38327]|eukprot:KNE68850.1 hypothetical protein AMAG_13490 [Allomyces macrogynus ATCC 38327]
MVLTVHVYPTGIKFGNDKPTFIHGEAMAFFMRMIEERQIPPPLVGLLEDLDHIKNGCLLLDLHDHRMSVAGKPAESRLVRIPHSPLSQWHSYMHNIEEAGRDVNTKLLLDFESKHLIEQEHALDLVPDPARLVAHNHAQYNEKKYQFRRSKKRSAWQRDDDPSSANDEESLLFLKDEKRARTTAFQPSFGRLDFIHSWRKRKNVADCNASKGCVNGPLELPCGRTIVHTIRFTRPAGMHTVYSILNIYRHDPTTHVGELRYGILPDTSVQGQTITFDLGPTSLADSFAQSFRRLYSIYNTLVFDSNPPPAAPERDMLEAPPALVATPVTAPAPPPVATAPSPAVGLAATPCAHGESRARRGSCVTED